MMVRQLAVGLAVACVLSFGFAGAAQADKVEWSGELRVDLGTLPDAEITGGGIATINGSAGGSHLTTLRVAGGITGTVTVPVTDPVVSVQIPSLRFVGVQLGTGTFAPISTNVPSTMPQLTQNIVPIPGLARICLVFPGCNSGSLDTQLTKNGSNTGVGIGGIVTVGRLGAIRGSLVATPWTIKTRTLSNRTDNMGITMPTSMGTRHGPASATSSTALTSGVIALVSANQLTTIGVPGNNDKLDLFGRLTMHVVPEPGILMLLGAGAIGLALVGRSRMKR